ncbi:MAG: TadE/TadG family type IV pilus assembly protein [Sphingomonas sp.]
MADQRGVSMVEFALSLPFLVLLYIGGYELSDGISAYRKVTTTTRTIADLTSQYTSVQTSDLDTILDASTQVLAPYKATAGSFVVSQIKIDGTGKATVDWSRGKNSSGLVPGTAFTIPASIKVNNTWLIVATVNFTYTPVAASGMIGTIPMQDAIFMNPRSSAQVKLY